MSLFPAAYLTTILNDKCNSVPFPVHDWNRPPAQGAGTWCPWRFSQWFRLLRSVQNDRSHRAANLFSRGELCLWRSAFLRETRAISCSLSRTMRATDLWPLLWKSLVSKRGCQREQLHIMLPAVKLQCMPWIVPARPSSSTAPTQEQEGNIIRNTKRQGFGGSKKEADIQLATQHH